MSHTRRQAIQLMGAAAVSLGAAAKNLEKRRFGKTGTGEAVDLFTLKNAKGMEAAITNYGAIVVSLKTPDRNGKMADVVLGFDSLDGYLGDNPYFGASWVAPETASRKDDSR